jgi:HSP20 family protein
MMSVRDLIPWTRPSHPSLASRDEAGSPLLSLQRDMNRLFDDFFRDISLPSPTMASSAWPQVDVAETDTEYKVTAEVPGLEEKDVELTLQDNALTISGERKGEHEERKGDRYYAERFHGRFTRTIPLPMDVEADKAAAAFKNGVLTVVLPKAAHARQSGKRIPIQKLS